MRTTRESARNLLCTTPDYRTDQGAFWLRSLRFCDAERISYDSPSTITARGPKIFRIPFIKSSVGSITFVRLKIRCGAGASREINSKTSLQPPRLFSRSLERASSSTSENRSASIRRIKDFTILDRTFHMGITSLASTFSCDPRSSTLPLIRTISSTFKYCCTLSYEFEKQMRSACPEKSSN